MVCVCVCAGFELSVLFVSETYSNVLIDWNNPSHWSVEEKYFFYQPQFFKHPKRAKQCSSFIEWRGWRFLSSIIISFYLRKYRFCFLEKYKGFPYLYVTWTSYINCYAMGITCETTPNTIINFVYIWEHAIPM